MEPVGSVNKTGKFGERKRGGNFWVERGSEGNSPCRWGDRRGTIEMIPIDLFYMMRPLASSHEASEGYGLRKRGLFGHSLSVRLGGDF